MNLEKLNKMLEELKNMAECAKENTPPNIADVSLRLEHSKYHLAVEFEKREMKNIFLTVVNLALISEINIYATVHAFFDEEEDNEEHIKELKDSFDSWISSLRSIAKEIEKK